MSEYNEIIERYSTLIEVMNKLESEVPEIEKIHRDLETIINNQSNIANNAIDSIKKQVELSLNDMGKASKEVESLLAKIESDLKIASESEKKLKTLMYQLDKKTSDIQNVITQQSNSNSGTAHLLSKILTIEKRLDALENTNRSSLSNSKSTPIISEPSNKIFPSSRLKFPSNSQSFNMKNIKNVSGKKPYGIAVEGNIIKVPYWTSMLDEVIPYIIRKYDIDCNELISAEYCKILPTYGMYENKTIPYFIDGLEGIDSNHRYRPISKYNISVYYGGASDVVDLLNDLLIDYLKILPENVEIFYHDK